MRPLADGHAYPRERRLDDLIIVREPLAVSGSEACNIHGPEPLLPVVPGLAIDRGLELEEHVLREIGDGAQRAYRIMDEGR